MTTITPILFMSQTRFIASVSNASQAYALSVHDTVTVENVAHHASELDNYIRTNTLEIASPLKLIQRLRDTTIQTGDRLLLQTRLPKPVAVPQGVRLGDKVLRFVREGFEVTSQGKNGLLVGVSDSQSEAIPDVDLRFFISPTLLDEVSRGCLWLTYDPIQLRWFATKIGQTRVFLDEYELKNEKIPIDRPVTLSLYAPHSTSKNRALGELKILVDTVKGSANQQTLPIGNQRLKLVLGLERTLDFIHANAMVEIGELVHKLTQHYQLAQPPQPYLLKLLAPHTRLEQLKLGKDEFLYAPRTLNFMQSTLQLRDLQNRSRVFELVSGLHSEQKVLGCRQQKHTPDANVDVDLYEVFVAHNTTTPQHFYMGLVWGHIVFHTEENDWWVYPTTPPMPLFLNNRRLNTPMKLIEGDVLSIGIEASNVVVRLGVELTNPV